MAAPGVNIEAIYPLTPVQEGILFHTLYAPDSPLYFQQYTAVIEGGLDVAAFRAAWQLALSRHPALRSLLTWEGRERPLQVVRTVVEPEWRIEDWRAGTPDGDDRRLDEFLEADRARGFALDVAPLMRFALFRVADEAHRFVWSHHHVVIDGWSMGIVLDEVFAAYEALARDAEPELPPPAKYREYVRWLHSRDKAGSEAHWRRVLAGFTVATSLRVEQPTGSPWAEWHAEEVVRLPAGTTERLGSTARRNGLTLNTMLRGAWALVLGRYSGDDDVVFGATFAGRPAELDRSTEMVGLFINTLPVRARIEHEVPLAAWLRGLQREQIDAVALESTALADVQAWSNVAKGEPLFQTLLVFENVPHPAGASGTLTTSDVRYLQRSNYPLAVLAMPGDELELHFLYDTDRYDAAVVRRMARQLVRLLEAMSEDLTEPVADVAFFPDAELHEVLVSWNDTAADYPSDQPIHELILAEAERAPSALAVVGESETLTYADLVTRASAVARRLRGLGIGANVRVGVAMERSPGTVVAILGVLLAGGAYVPLDPRQPPARLGYLLEDTSAAAVVVGLEPHAGAVPAGVATIQIDVAGRLIGSRAEQHHAVVATAGAGPDDLAYVLFTSGSTGRPKGVAVTHRSLVNSTHARLLAYGDRVGRFLLLSPFIFDSSIAGLFSSLTQGGTLVLPAPDMERDVRHLARLVAEHAVTHTLALPALYDLLLQHADPADLQSVRLVMVAGEACPPSLVLRHHERVPGAKLVNEYGPTEATVWCTVHHTEPSTLDEHDDLVRRVPIGRPIANTHAFVLDERGRPVPVAVPGELYIGGLGLAQGYLDHPELTEERFVSHDLPGHGPVRLYRTGDVARYLPDGSLDLLGRRDHQVKIRGQRIELGEIEMVLREHPEVRDAVVVMRSDDGATTNAQRLVAYAETAAGSAALQSYLAQRLPDVMIPSVVVPLAELPRGATGKVARAELPEPEAPFAAGGGHVSPQSDVERTLAEIWQGVLGIENVGATDNFFDLGGDSILSIRIIARAHEAGLAITPRQFFEFPTIAELARIVAGAESDGAPSTV